MTERYQNVAITIVADMDGFTKSIAPTGLSQNSSQFLSYTQSWFDDQGRTIETRDTSGLKTCTIYYPNGQVQYSGPLTSSAPTAATPAATPLATLPPIPNTSTTRSTPITSGMTE